MKKFKTGFILFILFVLGGCQQKEHTNFLEYNKIFYSKGTFVNKPPTPSSNDLKKLVKKLKNANKIPFPYYEKMNKDWQFVKGNPDNGLLTNASAMPQTAKPVNLPHRILAPDNPLWYKRYIDNEDSVVLKLKADDGEQVFVDGKKLSFYDYYAYMIPGKEEKQQLKIRVLNNAMHGGLDSVVLIPKSKYDAYKSKKRYWNKLDSMVTKLQFMKNPPQDVVSHLAENFGSGFLENLEKADKKLAKWPKIIAGPYLQNAGTGHLTIVWETDVVCEGKVLWGKDSSNLTQKLEQGKKSKIHKITLKSLNPDTEYYYKIINKNLADKTRRFKTNKEKGPFSFSVWADSQNGWTHFRKNVRKMKELPLDFSIGVGDFVDNGFYQEKWYDYLQIMQPLGEKIPVWMVPGNHDYDGFYNDLDPKVFKKYVYNQPAFNYFAWSFSNARFVAIDPNESFPIGIPKGSDQYNFLIDELQGKAWKEATWRFILIHQPPYSQGWEGYHGDKPVRKLLDSLNTAYGVDFVVSGHTHDYERLIKTENGHSTYYLIVGGAGGNLEPKDQSSKYPVMDKLIREYHFGVFDIDGNHLKFTAVGPDNRTIDQFEVSK